MKKLVALITMASFLIASQAAYGATISIKSNSVSFVVLDVFSIQFFNGGSPNTSIRYPDGQIVFPSYDPSVEPTGAGGGTPGIMVFTTAYAEADNKSDVGVVCKNNKASDWSVKIKMTPLTGGILATNVAFYVPDKVYDRNKAASDPSREISTGLTKQWVLSTTSDMNIFSTTSANRVSAPFGYLASFSFSVLPMGTASPSGQSPIGTGNLLGTGTHTFEIQYSMVNGL